MAYRRRPTSYNYDPAPPAPAVADGPSLLAAKAIRASSEYRDSSFSSAYEQSALSSPRESIPLRSSPLSAKDASSSINERTPKIPNESKQGFWGTLTRKAKAIIDDENESRSPEAPEWSKQQTSDRVKRDQNNSESRKKTDSPSLQKGIDAIASSLNFIGGTIGNALEEGITAVEHRTADIIQETRKIQIRKKTGSSLSQNQVSNMGSSRQQPMMQGPIQPRTNMDMETQLKASRDVAMAMGAKAKLLLRELKTVKADLAFAKERCAQLEEENKILRERGESGDHAEDDDLIRLQLESLLAEKARLAQENSVYSRENRFLREIVEYHQLTMQDVVYFDEGSEEVTEVYPIQIPSTNSAAAPLPSPTPTVPHGAIPQMTLNASTRSLTSQELEENVNNNPYVHMSEDSWRR